MKTTKILLISCLVIILGITACTPVPAPAAPTVAAPASPAIVGEDIVLELDNGQKLFKLTMSDLKGLPAVEGLGGIISSSGKITPPAKYKGVNLLTLTDLMGGLNDGLSIVVEAHDGYSMTFSADQVRKGQFITYDVSTGAEIEPLSPLQTIIAYERDGGAMDPQGDGTLRISIIGDSPMQVVDGHWAIKWVTKVTLKPSSDDWSIHLSGAREEDMDRGTFESGAAVNCHGGTFKDKDGQTWKGLPLYYLLGRIDDENKHSGEAFRDDLAMEGYTVEVVAKDGYTATLDSKDIVNNDRIIVANQMDGKLLDEEDFPLKLVGEGLTGKQMVGAIASISIKPYAESAEEPVATAVTAVQETAVAVIPELKDILPPPEKTSLEILGLIDQVKNFDAKALLELKPVWEKVEHPKNSEIEVVGVKLQQLLESLKVKAESTTLVITATDGYVTEIPVKDVLECPSCLLGWTEDGLMLYMPGFDSKAWAKNIAKIEFK